MPRKGGMRSIFFKAPSPLTSNSSSPLPSYASSSPYTIHHRTFSHSMMSENIDNAELIITGWEGQANNSYSFRIHHDQNSRETSFISMFTGDRVEAKGYLKSVKSLQTAMKFFAAENSNSEYLIRAQRLMQLAMNRLEKEFYQILKANRDTLDPESVSMHSARTSTSNSTARSSISDADDDDIDDEFKRPADSQSQVSDGSDQAPNLAMSDLRAIADAMISSGYAKECIKIYRITRKSIIDESLYHLGVERLTFSTIQKVDWELIEFKIRKWLNAVRAAVKVLFYGERILCDHVFHSSASIREACFTEISNEAAVTLFSFPELIAKTKLSPEKMFRILDMYESIAELWQELESIFSYDSSTAVKTQAVASLIKLGEAVRSMLTQFEAAMQKDSSKSAVPGGGVHPLTRYVMNYITFLADYSSILADIVADFPINAASLPEAAFIENSDLTDDRPTAAISSRLAWLILVLLCKLDGKAELYKDVALSYLFLANNLQYVIVKVRRSNLRYLLGEDWIAKHEARVKLYTTNYQKVGWNKVFAALPTNPNSDIMPERARNCFKNFNSAFEDLYRKQTLWTVPDSKLRDEIKISISTTLLPMYRAFYENYKTTSRRTVVGGVHGVDSVVRYTPDDLGNYLSDLFYGAGGGGSYGGSTSTTSSVANSPSGSSTAHGRHFR